MAIGGHCRQVAAALVLGVGLVTAGCSSGGSSQHAAAVKTCRAVADAYNSGYLPGASDSSAPFFVDLQKDVQGLTFVKPPALDANGVPETTVPMSHSALRKTIPYEELYVAVVTLDAPVTPSETSDLVAACARFGIHWKG